jgi:hypothetical protein
MGLVLGIEPYQRRSLPSLVVDDQDGWAPEYLTEAS